jgi:hypothetical protein
LSGRQLARQHLSMTAWDSVRNQGRRATIVAVALTAATVSVIAATAATSHAAVPGQPGFGAAARIAVGQAAATLAPRSGISGRAAAR